MQEVNWPESIPNIETDRLLLRELSLSDAKDMFEYARDPQVTKYVSWTTQESLESTRQMIEKMKASKSILTWAVYHKHDQKMIGHFGLHPRSLADFRAELFYAISRQYWGLGLTTEAVQALIDYGFRISNLNRIEARCEPDNIGSSRVMEKAGMQYEGLLRQFIFEQGSFRDLKTYSILRQEWVQLDKQRQS